MKKINIGLFVDTYFPMIDGVINVVDNYAKILSKFANVIVFAPTIDKNYNDNQHPYKIIRCKSIKTNFIDYVIPLPLLDKKFKNELKKCKLDIVHIHSPFQLGAIGIKYAKKNKIPCIGTMHSQYKLDFEKKLKNKILINTLLKVIINKYNKCDECWAVNDAIGRLFYEEYNCKKLPKTVGNATDMMPIKNTNYIKEKYNININEKILLFIGRLNTLKNILFIVESLYELKKIKPNFKFKMLFVGTGEDEKKLTNKITDLNLQNNIILCGKIADRNLIAQFYKSADLFLFPSIYDASSLVQIEAASQHTPTLFIKNTKTSSGIKDNINGYLSNYSTTDYAYKIIEIFENNNYKNVCNNAYNDLYIKWEDQVKDVYQKYIEIISNNMK